MEATSTPPTSPSRWVLPALCIGSFITMLTITAAAPFFPAMAREFDVSVALLGQVTAAMSTISALLGLVVGPLGDRYGARRLILVGLAAITVGLLDFWIAPVFPMLFLASIAGGLGLAAVPGLSLAIAATHFTGSAARRATGWTVGALSVAPIIGVPILTMVGEAAGWRMAFLTAALAAAITLVLVANWLPGDTLRPGDRFRLGSVLDAYRPLLHHAGMRRLYAASITRGICWFGMLTYLGAMLSDRLGLSTSEIGLAYMVGGTGYFLGSIIAGGPLARVPTRPLVVLSTLAMAVSVTLVLTAILGTAVTLAIMPLSAFALAVGWVGFVSLLTSETPAGAGTTMVLNQSVYNAGAAIGAVLGGGLVAVGGYDALALGMLSFGLLSALLVWRPVPAVDEGLAEGAA